MLLELCSALLTTKAMKLIAAKEYIMTESLSKAKPKRKAKSWRVEATKDQAMASQ